MRTNYEHKSRIGKRGPYFAIKVAAVIAFFLFVIYLFAPKLFPSVFGWMVNPFWKVQESMTREEVPVSMELQDAIVRELQRENIELKALLSGHASSTAPHRGVLAYVLKKPPFTAYDSYILDVGNDPSIVVGSKVYAKGNVLLGEVVERNGSWAKVKLYSSFGETYNVLIGEEGIQTTATGQGGGTFEAILPKDVKIKENDTVIIPDLEVSVFGIVKKITVDPARSFSTILFAQPVNIYEQKWVLVEP